MKDDRPTLEEVGREFDITREGTPDPDEDLNLLREQRRTRTCVSTSARSSSEELHEFVCDLARRAGELQLSRYEAPGKVTEKAPKT